MVQGIEDLRTPLSEIIELDKKLRGTLSGFMMPAFVIDLPGGGGKRLVSTYDSYDKDTGVAEYSAPGLPGVKGQITYTYHDPKPVEAAALQEFRYHQHQALVKGVTLSEFARTTFNRPTPQPVETMTRKPGLSVHNYDWTRNVPSVAQSSDPPLSAYG